MTLIELMVVIVILVTLVAGVLPLVSPNNDARKIGEASRALQTYFMQAQAEAARIGRPVGVGFRESSVDSSSGVGSGVALEAVQIVVPPVYPGSSTLSRVSFEPIINSSVRDVYTGKRFKDYVGAPTYKVSFQFANQRNALGVPEPDPLPSSVVQVGDVIEAQGHRFVVVDDLRNAAFNNTALKIYALICIRLDEVLQGTKAPPLAPPADGYTYGIHRQPMGSERTANSPNEKRIVSGESPLQFPAGVSIDLISSGFEASEMKTNFEFVRPSYQMPPGTTIYLTYSMGILFSPNGGVDSVWINDQRYTDASRVFFLVGRVENGNPDTSLYTNWGRSGQGGVAGGDISDEEFKDRQAKVNWLNLDSRWLMLNGNDGRLTFSQNSLVDPRNTDFQTDLRTFIEEELSQLSPLDIQNRGGINEVKIQLTRNFQIEAAHGLAHGHNDGGQRAQ